MDANKKLISERVIGCAFAVSNDLGVGFQENVYENALTVEMHAEGLEFEQQKPLKVVCRNNVVGNYIADFVVENRLIVELKALSQLPSQHDAQVMNYLKATGMSVGLLLNFGTARIGVKRLVNDYDDSDMI